MFDLHAHSNYSDGSEAPSAVVNIAKAAGLDLFALTDHDCIAGVPEAMARAKDLGLPFLSGAEMEASYHATLHLLTLGMDIHDSGFIRLVEKQEQFRNERNEKLDKKLKSIGMDVSAALHMQSKSITRAHYAKALVKLGYAKSMDDAYGRILGKNGIAYVRQERLPPSEIISAAKNAGGIVVLAHPMHMKCDPAALISDMSRLGIWGVEAYYYSATDGETMLFSSLARSHGLHVTCGSDFHGKDRPAARIGCCFNECRELLRTREELNKIFNI